MLSVLLQPQKTFGHEFSDPFANMLEIGNNTEQLETTPPPSNGQQIIPSGL
jgi:hypothetical protein